MLLIVTDRKSGLHFFKTENSLFVYGVLILCYIKVENWQTANEEEMEES